MEERESSHPAPAPAPAPDAALVPDAVLVPDADPAADAALAPDADPDPEWAAYVAWLDGELAAGRDPDYGPEPAVWELGDWDSCSSTKVPAAADPPCPRRGRRFGQGDEADVLPPGPLLVGLTEEAVGDLGSLPDGELIGVLQAARRQEIRETYKQALVIAEFARRREAAFNEAKARGVPVGCRAGGFPGEELAMELVTTRIQAGHQIETASDLVTRLPATLAGMAAGLIDDARAAWIAYYTRSLTFADATRADTVLAAAAPDLRVDQLARKAAALEMKLDPAAARARKEHEKRTNQRVEARREASGNASLSAREMDTAEAMAAKSYIDAMAAALRDGGLDAPLGALRVLALGDLTQGRNPLDRLRAVPAASSVPGSEQPGRPEQVDDPSGRAGSGTGSGHAGPAPIPALINLIVPAGTILGWSGAPTQAGAWGLLDREETGAVVTAASRHPRTRWCVTLTNPKGEAIAHACARGQHPWAPEDRPDSPGPGGGRDGPAPEQAARLHDRLRGLNLTFEPIASDTCDHAHAQD
ncbi:MAG TPA: DUF222 domain-containing protein, partial [Trebonia sp.]